MSTTLDTVTTAESEPDRPTEMPPAAWLTGAADAIDVSGLSPARVAAYARRTDAAVGLERKGGRTYLVVG
jgi:hypothetical protein